VRPPAVTGQATHERRRVADPTDWKYTNTIIILGLAGCTGYLEIPMPDARLPGTRWLRRLPAANPTQAVAQLSGPDVARGHVSHILGPTAWSA